MTRLGGALMRLVERLRARRRREASVADIEAGVRAGESGALTQASANAFRHRSH